MDQFKITKIHYTRISDTLHQKGFCKIVPSPSMKHLARFYMHNSNVLIKSSANIVCFWTVPPSLWSKTNTVVGDTGPHDRLNSRVGQPHKSYRETVGPALEEEVVSLLEKNWQAKDSEGLLSNACSVKALNVSFDTLLNSLLQWQRIESISSLMPVQVFIQQLPGFEFWLST